MKTSAQLELEQLETRASELRIEIRNDRLAPIRTLVQEALKQLENMSDGRSLHDTSTGANHWSYRDEIERNLTDVLESLTEWQRERI